MASMDKEALAARLEDLANTHMNSVSALHTFVDDTSRGIQTLERDIGSLDTSTLAAGFKSKDSESDEVPWDWLAGYFLRVKLHYPALLLEMAFIYRVALFDAFLTDVVTAILTHKPDVLRSKDKERGLTTDQVLSLLERNEIVAFLVKKEVKSFSYKSVGDQMKYLNKKFNINLDTAGNPQDQMVEIFARRNIFVHNNGVVNAESQKEIGYGAYKIGDRAKMAYDYWSSSDQYLTVKAQMLLKLASGQYCDREVLMNIKYV